MTDTLVKSDNKIDDGAGKSGAQEDKKDGQDEIDASRAPLIEHLTELRQRLIYSLMAFFGMFVVCFFFAKPIYNVLVWPFVRVVGAVDEGGFGGCHGVQIFRRSTTRPFCRCSAMISSMSDLSTKVYQVSSG